ncbi:T9SS type A sorting domain-containing protein [Paraflavitalea speifideaquila]|uniref:T9SS type A sorting domain-containing protein n=1 Tax=Paraflavitalea speifideaquila TaxID=3076558 RepID=UPI0028E702AA|nr:T9SS type A sorting domain-containing protein [Paraflavitalea speifideiaquila]
MDQDNHNLTFGTANANRMVVLSSAKSREAVMEAIRSMRYYASQDCNVRIDFKNDTRPMGSQVMNSGVPGLSINVTDPDAELVTTIEIWGGQVGSATPAAAIKTYTNTASINFTSGDPQNTQPNNTTWYYYAVITQEDGNKAVTAPIWYTRNDMLLPVTLASFRAKYDEVNNRVNLTWTTAQENNSKEFIIEKSGNGTSFEPIGKVNATGYSNKVVNYSFTDEQPLNGNTYYRLQQVDLDERKKASAIVKISINKSFSISFGPNPAYQYLTINIQNNHAPLAIQLTDLNGRLLQQRNLQASSNQVIQLPVSQLPGGMYLLKITGTGGTRTEKVMVK